MSVDDLIYAGFDLAPNHTGAVFIDGRGELKRYAAITNHVSVAANDKNITLFHATKLRNEMKKADFKLYRLAFFKRWFQNQVNFLPYRVAVEGYAFGVRNSAAVYEIAEIGGCARCILLEAKIPFRLWSPKALKNFAGIKGKEKPIEFVHSRYGKNWQKLNVGTKSDTAGDLADAHVLAHMALTEQRLCTGKLKRKDFPGFRIVDGVDWLTERILDE